MPTHVIILLSNDIMIIIMLLEEYDPVLLVYI